MRVVSSRLLAASANARARARPRGSVWGTIQLAPKLGNGVKVCFIPNPGAARKRLLAGLAFAWLDRLQRPW